MRLVVVKCSFIVGIEMYIFDRTPAASDILCVDFEASLVLRRCIATKFLNIVYIKESFPLRKRYISMYNSLLRSLLKLRWERSGFFFLFFRLNRINVPENIISLTSSLYSCFCICCRLIFLINMFASASHKITRCSR